LVLSGNPIRSDITLQNKEDAKKIFSLDASKKTLVIVGGSLGARSINEALKNNIENLEKLGINILWQTGDYYFEEYKKYSSENIKVLKYFDRISDAYSAADLVISRAGATTIAEVALLGLPMVFVPSPNVAADHQYKNAEVLKDNNAAKLLRDSDINKELVAIIKKTIFDEEKLKSLKENIKKFAKPDAIDLISKEIIKLASVI
jgi:UDP-N-acetylglucosamine--N-acetylmuramyl-(pentapeptide) pyrophosphoryl-undecaprenol N-acetylglucosamine transferase